MLLYRPDNGYHARMSVLRQIARYAAQRVASNPAAREKAIGAARIMVAEASQIAGDKDRARAAGRAFRRALNNLKVDR